MTRLTKGIIALFLVSNIYLGWNLYQENQLNERLKDDILHQYFMFQRMATLKEALKQKDNPNNLLKSLKHSYGYLSASQMTAGNATPAGQHLYLPMEVQDFILDGLAIVGHAIDNGIDGKLSEKDIERLVYYQEWMDRFYDEVRYDYNRRSNNDMKVIRDNLITFSEKYMNERSMSWPNLNI